MKTNFPRLVFGCLFTVLACFSIATGKRSPARSPAKCPIPGAVVAARTSPPTTSIRAWIRQATTNDAGVYHIEFLPIGHYQVSVQSSGFNTETLPPFTLEVLQTANFNVKLTVGSAQETVSVSEAAPILNTTDPTISSTFTANTIENFPLNGLDFSALTLYLPGAVTTTAPPARQASNAAPTTPTRPTSMAIAPRPTITRWTGST